MAANPTYLLAFGFMISTSLLFVLWHCRHLWFRRRREEERAAELLSWDVGNLQRSTAEGAPSFVINRLPVFKFNPKGAPQLIPREQEGPHSRATPDSMQSQDQCTTAAAAAYDQPSQSPAPAAAKHQATASAPQHSPFTTITGSISITIKPSLFQRAELVLLSSSSSSSNSSSRGACSCSSSCSTPPPLPATADEAAADGAVQKPPHATAAEQEGKCKTNPCSCAVNSKMSRNSEAGPPNCVAACNSSSGTSCDDIPIGHCSCTSSVADDDASPTTTTTSACKGTEDSSISSSREASGSCTVAKPISMEQSEDESPLPPGEVKDGDTVCVICLCDYEEGEHIKQLPCKHYFHVSCIDPWLARHGNCPLCKQPITQLRPVHVLLPLWLELVLQRAAVTGTEVRGLRGPAAELAAELGVVTGAPQARPAT